ncbi:unnamed protein product [Enterobius vermicularis]|uniref:Transposase n=1 Tax=Enterobius vermicularis TaxID=51028 RepID=A0A0N4UYB6_ENTVE|nr:unnamed protein product [Enterobius vermicularis]
MPPVLVNGDKAFFLILERYEGLLVNRLQNSSSRALVQTNLTNHEEGKSYAYASGKKETIAQGTTPQETFLGKCNAVPRG